MRDRRYSFLSIVWPFSLFLTVGLLVYANTFHVPFVLDDKSAIVENHFIKSLSGFFDNGWHYNPRRFIGYLTFALNYRFGGLDVTGYHAVNLAIHLVTSMLVYWFTLLAMRTPLLKNSRLSISASQLALAAALLFVSHPVQTQAVTYISQRFASLATMFYLMTMTFYLRARLHQEDARRPLHWKAVCLFFLALFTLLCAMTTKEIAFTLPTMLILSELCFFDGNIRKKLFSLAPFIIPIIIIPLTIINTRVTLGKLLADMDLKLNVASELSRGDYLLTQFSVIATYIRLLILPVNQNLDYAYPVFHSLFAPRVFLSFLLIAGLCTAALFLLARVRRGADPGLRLVSFGIGWFFVTLSVESSVIPIVDVIFEHRLYLPSIGAFLAISAGLALVVRNSRSTAMAAVIIALVLSAATWRRNLVWGDEVSLWRDTVQKSPGKDRPHNNLGEALRKKGRLDEAMQEVELAVRLNPRSAEARSNLGAAWLEKGERQKAQEHFLEAEKLNPNLFAPHYNLGIIFNNSGQPDRAIQQFMQALKINPDVAEAHNHLAASYAAKDMLGPAVEHFREAVRLNPEKVEYRKNLELAIQIGKRPLK